MSKYIKINVKKYYNNIKKIYKLSKKKNVILAKKKRIKFIY